MSPPIELRRKSTIRKLTGRNDLRTPAAQGAKTEPRKPRAPGAMVRNCRPTAQQFALAQSSYFDFFLGDAFFGESAAGAVRRRRAAVGRMIGGAVVRGSVSKRWNGARCN
jgi:hypothetical protein